MADNGIGRDSKPRRGPVALSELVGKAIGRLASRRGFATADLIAAWPGIVGARFADCTRPEKIAWPKGEANEWRTAVLIVKVDGPRAVFFQHEAGQVIERVNAFLGYAAIGRIRIVQAPVAAVTGQAPRVEVPLDAEEEARLGRALAGVENEGLRSALDKLGRGVLKDKSR
jgi:hypothetical protein